MRLSDQGKRQREIPAFVDARMDQKEARMEKEFSCVFLDEVAFSAWLWLRKYRKELRMLSCLFVAAVVVVVVVVVVGRYLEKKELRTQKVLIACVSVFVVEMIK